MTVRPTACPNSSRITAEEFELHMFGSVVDATMNEITTITYLKGDATTPQVAGNRIIAHVCNDLGAWGKGFVLAFSACWSQPENEFREWYRSRLQNGIELGALQLVQVEQSVWVANTIGQHGIKTIKNGPPPIRYDALEKCLSRPKNWLRSGWRKMGLC